MDESIGTALKPYFLSIITFFIAFDIFHLLPLFCSPAAVHQGRPRNQLILDSLFSATIILFSFVFLARALFVFFNISNAEFEICGGVLLFFFCVKSLFFSDNIPKEEGRQGSILSRESVFLAHPGILIVTLLLVNIMGTVPAIISFCIVILAIFIVLRSSERILGALGMAGVKRFSNMLKIFLAAISVMLIRAGALDLLRLVIKAG